MKAEKDDQKFWLAVSKIICNFIPSPSKIDQMFPKKKTITTRTWCAHLRWSLILFYTIRSFNHRMKWAEDGVFNLQSCVKDLSDENESCKTTQQPKKSKLFLLIKIKNFISMTKERIANFIIFQVINHFQTLWLAS